QAARHRGRAERRGLSRSARRSAGVGGHAARFHAAPSTTARPVDATGDKIVSTVTKTRPANESVRWVAVSLLSASRRNRAGEIKLVSRKCDRPVTDPKPFRISQKFREI